MRTKKITDIKILYKAEVNFILFRVSEKKNVQMLIQNYTEKLGAGKEIFLPKEIKKPDGFIQPVQKELLRKYYILLLNLNIRFRKIERFYFPFVFNCTDAV